MKTQIENIGFYHLGNGYVVADRTQDDPRTRDFLELAFIHPNRSIDFRMKLAPKVKAYIENFAATDTSTGSVTAEPHQTVLHPIKPKTI